MVCNFAHSLEGVHGLDVLDHRVLIVDYAEPGGLATRRMPGTLFFHCLDGAAGRAESGDYSLFYFVQPKNEVLCFHGGSLVQDDAGVGLEERN